jgi:hypothetical protein
MRRDPHVTSQQRACIATATKVEFDVPSSLIELKQALGPL